MQTIWLKNSISKRTFGPTAIDIDGFEDLKDLIEAVRNNSDLGIPKGSHITLYTAHGIEIKPSDSLESLAVTHHEANPLILKVSRKLNERILWLFGSLVLLNAIVWAVSIAFYRAHSPSSVPLLLVAYTLGLRHALDADHIAAIDNATRRFILNGEAPVTLGLCFSLGHSTIVIMGTIVIAVVANTVFVDNYNQISGLIGSVFSAAFLLLIGIINCVSIYILVQNLRKYQAVSDQDKDLNNVSAQGGLFSWIFGTKLFKLVNRPWKMYFVGFLFGLGFDTATEIALLSIVVIQAADGASWIVLFLSFLFTCGMTLLDSIDGVLMLKIYGWDLISPLQKLIFNLFITTLSVIFAIGIALVQILGIFQSQYQLEGPFWDFISDAGDHFENIGIFMIASFLASFVVAYVAWKLTFKKEQSSLIISALPV